MFPVNNLRFPHVAPISVAVAISSIPSLALWHAQIGHASSVRVQHLASRGLLSSVSKENFDCFSCHLGKQPALPFNTNESMFIDFFNLIHSDVWGLPFRNGNRLGSGRVFPYPDPTCGSALKTWTRSIY